MAFPVEEGLKLEKVPDEGGNIEGFYGLSSRRRIETRRRVQWAANDFFVFMAFPVEEGLKPDLRRTRYWDHFWFLWPFQ